MVLGQTLRFEIHYYGRIGGYTLGVLRYQIDKMLAQVQSSGNTNNDAKED
jgi:hypothetical protein